MGLTTLTLGSKGDLVWTWQYFLLGLGFYKWEVDSFFGPLTKKATLAFQGKAGVPKDGVVDLVTWSAAMAHGLDPLDRDNPLYDDVMSANWPPKPPDVKPLSTAAKHKLFGRIACEHAPVPGNPENIQITNDWQKHIDHVVIPQLAGLPGAGRAKKFPFHQAVCGQVQGFFQDLEDYELTPLLLSYSGSWVPRFVRGSRTTLSSHSWGTAFDINAAWNGYGRMPALAGKEGSVRPLVELALSRGLYWGGWFARRDGMHFEVFELHG